MKREQRAKEMSVFHSAVEAVETVVKKNNVWPVIVEQDVLWAHFFLMPWVDLVCDDQHTVLKRAHLLSNLAIAHRFM